MLTQPSTRHQTRLRSKFMQAMLLVSGAISISTLIVVVVLNVRSSERHLAAVQRHIEEGIGSKGRVLTDNHALALRGLVLDNAFLDMQRLLERAVEEDRDVIYGIFVNSDLSTAAYSRRARAADSKREPPATDAWKELGLSNQDVITTRPQALRVSRLGQDVLEVAAPVTDEDGQLLGTVRYGLSTARMHEALRSAEADSRAQLWRSLLLIGGLVSLATLLGLLLSRVQAARITRPLAQLTEAANALAGSDRSVRVAITSGDELELLGSSFNRMVNELDASYGELERINRTLEQKVDERTAELRRKNRDMRLVLDNVDQGFITLAADGRMATERSKIVEQWFGVPDADMHFFDYLARALPDLGLRFQLAWEQLQDGILPLDVCIAQLPERFSVGERSWRLRYLPFGPEDKLEGVLVVIDDITTRLLLERQEAEQQELMHAFQRLVRDRSGFASFMSEASRMVAAICSPAAEYDAPELKRTLHTLKGNAACLGLNVMAELCHKLEEQQLEDERLDPATLAELSARWEQMTAHVRLFMGDDAQRRVELSEPDYTAFLGRLSRDPTHQDLLQEALAWKFVPVERVFERLAEPARSLARRLGKAEPVIALHGNGIRLDEVVWRPLLSALTHVIRNAVDHGIEPEAERLALGKPIRPTLSLSAQLSSTGLSVEISDDGRGIDWPRIADRARSLSLPHGTPAELLACLCHVGVSSCADVSDVSGRGVGMAAVKESVAALGGQLDVRSARGAGTTWILSFAAPDGVARPQRRSLPPVRRVDLHAQ